MKSRVAIVGCGVVGAAIAYELSKNADLAVTVCDRQLPAQASTGAALGVLMAAISHKLQGNSLRMRLFGVQQYNQWVPELEAVTGRSIPFNRQGILRLCFEGEDLERWHRLAEMRRVQGWQLEVRDRLFLESHCPQLNLDRVAGAVYSPNDRQIDPTALTLALVAAAQQNGVVFQFETLITGVEADPGDQPAKPMQIHTDRGLLEVDRLVIAAGLGSTSLTAALQQPVDIRPVLGQAVQVKLAQPLGNANFQPVVTGDDVHLVPLGDRAYWIGATVEFPADETATLPLEADSKQLAAVMQQAIALCPALKNATIERQWFGLRPRPEARPAPIVELLPGYRNVILATGHYRNGVLLAPATAAKVRELIQAIR